METIKVILEKTNTGYSAYMPDIDGCVSVGDDLEDTKQNMLEAVELFVEVANEEDIELPEALKGDYVLDFKIDARTFFEWMKGIITKAGLSQLTGLNKSLISQYANGVKNPSQKQLMRIESALHKFGGELQAISF